MLIPSLRKNLTNRQPSLSRRVNANSQLTKNNVLTEDKLIKKGEC